MNLESDVLTSSQASLDANTRAMERMEDRMRVLEAKPSLEACKAEIMSSVASAINSNALSEVRHDVSALRSTILALASSSAPSSVAGDSPDKGLLHPPGLAALSAPISAAKFEGGGKTESGARGGGGEPVPEPTSLPKAPAGLPNARIFRKLQASTTSGSSSSPLSSVPSSSNEGAALSTLESKSAAAVCTHPGSKAPASVINQTHHTLIPSSPDAVSRLDMTEKETTSMPSGASNASNDVLVPDATVGVWSRQEGRELASSQHAIALRQTTI